MYWPVAQSKINRESLEAVIVNCARSSRAAEFGDQVDSEDSNKEEEPVNKKRSNSHLAQLKKKKSISNIEQLNLSDHDLSRTHSFVGNLEQSSEEEDQEVNQEDTMAAFNHNEAWCRIKQLAITSNKQIKQM